MSFWRSAEGKRLLDECASDVDVENHVMPLKCTCNSAACRKQITGKDWLLPELQDCYGGPLLTYDQQEDRPESLG